MSEYYVVNEIFLEWNLREEDNLSTKDKVAIVQMLVLMHKQ